MTEILCKWLNEKVHLEPKLAAADPNFGEKFSNGYLFGHILYKHDLQPDFCLFSKGITSDAKLNNFIRLQPTFKLLSIPFDINAARDVMTEKPGAAIQLMYQLFMALNRKIERKQTSQSLECMKSPGKVRLQKIETDMFQGRLRNKTPRQVDLNFEEMVEKFKEQKRLFDEKLSEQKKEEERRVFLQKMESCQKSLEYSREVRERRSMLYTKLKPIKASSKRAQSSPGIQSSAGLNRLSAAKSRALAEETKQDIHMFELSLKSRPNLPKIGVTQSLSSNSVTDKPHANIVRAEGSVDYLTSLHQRVADNTKARSERDKRRRRVLVEQMEALFEQEEEKRDKLLIERLARRCQQERRIATQLMHIRKEKDTIRNNRILRQQQYAEQREQEFQQALDREAALALLEEKEKKERLRHHKEIYQRSMAEKAEKNYQMNFVMCHKIVLQILDLSTKIAHYRELTKKLVPAKIVRDWKTLFVTGRSLYEETLDTNTDLALDVISSSLTRSSVYTQQEISNDQLLNDVDFQEYKDAVGEWCPAEDLTGTLPDTVNTILSHAVFRLLDQVDPPQPPPTPPYMPKFILRASLTGKPFSGKTSVLNHLKEKYELIIISIESITSKAVEQYLSEKNDLGKEVVVDKDRQSSGSSNTQQEDSIAAQGSSTSVSSLTPQIALNPSSSVELGSMSEGVSGTEPDKDVVQEEKIKRYDSNGESMTIEISQEQILQLSPLAQLGHKAYTAMANGEALDDGLLVDILLHEVRTFPEGCGWVMDNFPTTASQAKLLSEALSVPSSLKPNISRDFVLLGERKSSAEKLHACGLDIVFHLMASTETILASASNQDKLEPHASNKLEQIQHRVLAYSENWPPLRRWFSKFKVVSNIDANVELDALCEAISKGVLEVLNKNKQADAMKRLGYDDVLSCGSVTSLASITSSPASKPTSVKSRSTRTHSPSSHHRPSRPSSAETATSPNRGGRRSRKRPSKTPESPLRHAISSSKELPIKSEWMPVNLEATPGGPEWLFYYSPIPDNLARGMARKWPAVEQTFIKTLKQVFQQLRDERECICQYFFLRRKEFSTYLCRPDHKQEFISQWQTTYNEIESHLRCEDVMKAELHHRIDDLADKLWDICEHRKDCSKEEQKRIAEEQWLEDHIGLLSNHYISIMQAELDRFQDTVLLLKDYYNSTDDKVPDKLPEMSRIALIELQPTQPQDPPSSQVGSTHSIEHQSSKEQVESKEEETASTPTRDSIYKKRVTLIPRQTPPDPLEDKAAHRKKSTYSVPSGSIPGVLELTEGPLDQQLINYAFNTALIAVVSMVHGEVKVLDSIIAEAKKPPKPKTPPPEVKEEKPAKGKKGKASPAAKKGKTPPAKKGAPPPEPPPDSPKPAALTHDEIMSKQKKLHMCKEFREAILIEEKRMKTRLELIRVKSLANVDMMTATGNAMQEEMDEWVQTCYDQEMTSVSHLLDILKQAVENEEKLLSEITLPGVKFEIRESIITFVPTPPPTPPPPVEPSDPTYFTVEQLRQLHQQLVSVCPSGFMLVKVLVDTLQGMTSRSSKGDALPSLWKNATKQRMETVVEHLYGPDTDFVDWRRFLLCAALPWPLPSTQDLLEAWSVLVKDKDTVGKKTVNKRDFMAAELWLDRPTESKEQVDTAFNRNHAFKEALFDMFCEGDMLDVKHTLLYLCADPYPRAGLFKALSLVTGIPLVPNQDADEQVTILLEDFHHVLTLGSHPNAGISMEDLLEVFVQVEPNSPNEVCLVALLFNRTAVELLHPATGYFLPDLSGLLKPAYAPLVEGTS